MVTATRHSSLQIADVVRQRICLSDPARETVMHEGELAEEFGVSRTPVRQVLQRLAYERLVEIRSGVGTVVPQLDPEERPGNARVAGALMRAAAECAQDEMISAQTRLSLLGLTSMLRDGTDLRADDVYQIRARLLETLSEMVTDSLLRDALRNSQWRLVRWRMHDFTQAPDQVRSRIAILVQVISDNTARGRISDLLGVLADRQS